MNDRFFNAIKLAIIIALVCLLVSNDALGQGDSSLSVVVDPVENGSIQLDKPLPEDGKYESGTVLTVRAAAAKLLKSHEQSNGKVGVVGFCFGGGMANTLAVRIPDVINAAVPFYGRQPATEDVPKIKTPLLLHYGELDRRINEGWPAYESALMKNNVEYTAHIYEGANHGFHNDTTPRYDKEAAELAWKRTLDFFRLHLNALASRG